ncbi:phenylalanine--tRNA ligase subunit alpha [Euryarchaeota archaeon]|nr:phenylalanine--tRNA ligase subunit alpha [Euryarchaeota archaeon]|tara:strand:+ start:777 stop:2270 length:1494 start_codon:yes stop_codon:yes gene_type:complete
MTLGNNEKKMLRAMLTKANHIWTLDELLEVTEWTDQVHVAGSGKILMEENLVQITETKENIVTLGDEGNNAVNNGLLEFKLWNWVIQQSESNRTMKGLFSAGFERHEAGPGVGLLKSLGVSINSGIFISENEDKVSIQIQKRTDFINKLSDNRTNAEELDDEMVEHFKTRKGLINIEENITREWKLTKKGMEIQDSELEQIKLIGEITPEFLQKEGWESAHYKEFDINADAPIPMGGRPHPMQSLIERIRSVFLEMGFSEIEGDYVQSAGWNMDALFIPQSHPARTMQDTFYLDEPKEIDIPEDMLDLWASVHESGHDTGSLGWGAKFDKEESKRGLLRTHTTVNTVKHIAENPEIPCRVFGIGRVFRQETIDRTHLPEFHQIEGIIHEPNASLPMLISTLKTFYSKMGYPDVRVRPAYFPYTEPSVEVEVYWRGKWLELGGAGIFRPEVTEPLGSEWPVCAWGMGLERLAMLVLELDDIRELYQPDLERLSRMPIL